MLSDTINELFDNIPEDIAQQTSVLRRVAEVARNLWASEPESSDLDLLAQKVGDAARVESNRIPLGESSVLGFFCSVVSTQGVRATLIVQCLRIIGNSCADEDENRERVVASGCLPSLVLLLNDNSMLPFLIPVLFNICVDFEPAQKAIYKAGINPELISLISGPRQENAASLMSFVCKLLGFVATQEPEANLVHPATPFVLLSLATNQPSSIETEDFLEQASVALTYLAQEQFQQTFLETPGSINLILQAFSKACGSLDNFQISPEDQAQIKQVHAAFTATLADLSAQPLFTSSYPLDSDEVQILQRWISSSHLPLQSAACLVLGNIARSDEKCISLVQQCAIHKPLIAILSDPTNVDAGLLHSVLSFLKNLAIPTENKPILGAAGLFDSHVLPRIWDLDTQPQVQFDAVSLTRLLLVGCPANVRRIITAPSEDRSKLHLLVDLNTRSDHEPTKMETARAITTVCRVLHSSSPTSTPHSSIPSASTQPSTSTSTNPPTPSASPSLKTFYSNNPKITDAMLSLGTQSKFPVLRSELIFVFALMARTSEGASTITQAIQRSELEFVSFIGEAVTGSPYTPPPDVEELHYTESPDDDNDQLSFAAPSDVPSITEKLAGLGVQAPTQQPPASVTNVVTAKGGQKSMQDVDRENALVLIAELLQRCSNELPPGPRLTFQMLLHEGGERLLRERGEGEGEGERGEGIE